MTTGPRSATSRMAALFGVFTGTAVLLFIGTFPPRIVDAFHDFPWWTAWVVATETLCALALLTAGLTGRPRLQRGAATALAGSYCFSSAWMLAIRGLGHGTEADVVWHEAYPSIIVIGLVPFLRTRMVLLLAVALFTVVGLLAVDDPGRWVVVNILHMYSLGGFSVAVAYAILGIATLSDEESERTRERISIASVAEAEQMERERVDGLIHDAVMSTLLAAAGVGSEPRVVASAENALAELDALRFPRGDDQLVPVEDFVHSLRSGLHFIDPGLAVTTSITEAPVEPILPVSVARDLTAAAAEALRNSVIHARGHRRSATVSYRDDAGGPLTPGVVVVVEDDGPGYDSRTVPPHRMGTRASIVGRMDAVPGAGATIETAPGAGVRVSLTWTTP